jgi:hypothetical protein
MARKEADLEADIKAAKDRDESISLMEPLLIGEGSRHRVGLTDLALELAQKSAGFRRSLPESLLSSLADLVRSMNSYLPRSGHLHGKADAAGPTARAHPAVG